MKKIHKIFIVSGCAAVAAAIMFVSVSSGNPSSPVTALQVMQEAQTSASQSVAIFVPETTETPAVTPVAVSPGATTAAAATASIQANTNQKPSSSGSTGSGSGSGTVPKSTPTPAPNPTNAPTATPEPYPATAPTGAPTPCPSQDAQKTIDDTHNWIDDNHPTPAPPDPSQPGIGNW